MGGTTQKRKSPAYCEAFNLLILLENLVHRVDSNHDWKQPKYLDFWIRLGIYTPIYTPNF